MSLQNIISRIKEETDKEIDEIISTAKSEKERRLKEAREQIEEEKKQRMERMKREIENRKRAEIAKIKQEARKELIKLKEEIIRECFNKAIERLKNLKGEEYKKIVEKLMRETVKEIGKDCKIIPSRKEDEEIAKKLNLDIESKKIDSIGGFIAVSNDQRITIDNSFESILERKEKELRAEIGKLLFQGVI